MSIINFDEKFMTGLKILKSFFFDSDPKI